MQHKGKNHQGGKLQVWFYDEKTWKLKFGSRTLS
jgi:hypothetical protein